MFTCSPQGWRDQVEELVKAGNKDAFFTFFEGGKNADAVFAQAEQIFSSMFMDLDGALIKKRKRCLDIGYGSGAMMFAAAKHFDESYGVDVHTGFNFIRPEWTRRDMHRAKRCFPMTVDGSGKLPYPDNYFDFIYSWVSICSFDSLKVLDAYLKEIYRKLTPNGIAKLYFPRLVRSGSRQTFDQYLADLKKEETLKEQYREGGKGTKVRAIRLVLSLSQIQRMALLAGFTIKSTGTTFVMSEKGEVLIGGQHSISLMKEPILTTTSTSSTSTSTTTTAPPVIKKRRTSMLIRRKKKNG